MKTDDKIKNLFEKSMSVVVKRVLEVSKHFIENVMIDEESFLVNKQEIKYWRNKIFYIIALTMLFFGAPLMFFGAYLFYKTGYTAYAIFEVILYIISALVILNKALSIDMKKYYITYNLYLISIFLLVTTGLLGGGMVCVVFSLILSGCLFEKKQTIHFVIFNIIVFTILTVLLFSGFFDGTTMEAYKQVWFINGITAQSCGILLLVLMNTIYIGLQKQTQYIRMSEASLAASEIKHKAMIANISDAIVIIDKNGTLTYISPNLEQRFPWMSRNIMSGSFYEKIHPEDQDYVKREIQSLLNEYGSKKTIEARYLFNSTEVGYLELTAVNLIEDDNIRGVLINYSDITKRKIREQEILYLIQHDSLTGLYNRTHYEMVKELLDTKEHLPLSIIVGDINGLKIINDSLGHSEGDKLLITISKIIEKCCRPGDIIARMGGDEFNILLPNTKSDEAMEVIHRINRECEEYNRKISGDLYHLSISLGYSTRDTLVETIENTQKIAEDFMYKRKLLEGRSFHSSIISSIRMALYEKSHETEQHALRLIKLSKEVGNAIGLTNQQFDELELFSTLHDIGKIGIDNQILNKPGKLTDEEWVKMKKHSEIGYRIAMASPELMSIAYYILTHHERWDGSGYPQGLVGENIPLLSRILALADAYDAMTEDRPYRKGMLKEAAIEEIIRNAGTQFDPVLSSIFVKIVSDKEGLYVIDKKGQY